MILLCSLATAASASFVYEFFSVDLEATLSPGFEIVGLCSSIFVLTNVLLFQHRIARIFSTTQQIYDAGNSIFSYLYHLLTFFKFQM